MSLTVIRTIRIVLNLILLVLAIMHITGLINISPTLLIILASVVLISIFVTRMKESQEKDDPNKKK